MRILSTLLIAASVAAAAGTTYTATSLNPPGATIGFANLIALNNKGQVLGDASPLGRFSPSRSTPRTISIRVARPTSSRWRFWITVEASFRLLAQRMNSWTWRWPAA